MLCDKATQWLTFASVDELVEGRQECRVESTPIVEEKEVVLSPQSASGHFGIWICVYVLFIVKHFPDMGFPKNGVQVMGS
jgi:hypothetical protein